MTRSRVIGLLLFMILLGCVAVIVLDQLGLFGSSQTVSAPGAPPSAPVPGTPSTGDGYGELK